MSEQSAPPGPWLLGGYRGLDLSDENGLLCGKMLADLGADVIKVERPGGDPARGTAPFYHDIPDPQKSLPWFAFNAGKRGVTLNIETTDGRDIFKRLVKSVDFIVESWPPGYMDSIGLGYQALEQVNPKLVMTSITPFGQTGPYKDFKSSDLVTMALGGYMYLCGDPDRPPVRISTTQAGLHAAGQAAVATMIALYHRGTSGRGQHIDVSVQASLVACTLNAIPWWQLRQINLQRAGAFRGGWGAAKVRNVWPCRDGFVSFFLMGGTVGAATNRRIVAWMDEEGLADDLVKTTVWEDLDMGTITQELQDRLERPIAGFFMAHTRAELYQEAVRRGIMLYPVSGAADSLHSPQLAARQFWVNIEHPELGTSLRYPGPGVKMTGAQCGPGRRAPLIGEHNEEVYVGELGLSSEDLTLLKQAGVI